MRGITPVQAHVRARLAGGGPEQLGCDHPANLGTSPPNFKLAFNPQDHPAPCSFVPSPGEVEQLSHDGLLCPGSCLFLLREHWGLRSLARFAAAAPGPKQGFSLS